MGSRKQKFSEDASFHHIHGLHDRVSSFEKVLRDLSRTVMSAEDIL